MVKKMTLLLVALVVLTSLGYVYAVKKTGTRKGAGQVVKAKIVSLIEVAVDKKGPFEELTIEYLRSKSYGDGSIQVIRDYQDNPNYTSHIATYDSWGLTISGLLTKPKGGNSKGRFSRNCFCSRVCLTGFVCHYKKICGVCRRIG